MRKSIAVPLWALIALGVLVVALVGLGGFTFGQNRSLNAWVGDFVAIQQTEAARVCPTAAPAAEPTADPTALLKTAQGVLAMDVVKFGDASRPLVIVEVTDPSCPYCHVAGGHNPEIAAQIDARFKYVSEGGSYQPPVPEIRKLVEEGKAAYAFVYFPGHGAGELATKALYCAFDQGKFWEAHDLLYTMEGYMLINNTVKNDAANIGTLVDFLKGAVDAPALTECLESGKYDQRLQQEALLAQASLFDPQGGGTPTYIINNTRFSGAYPGPT